MQGNFSVESLSAFQKAIESEDFDFSETYDFTRCVRSDGSAYGTGGTCRKGSPEAKQPADDNKDKKVQSGFTLLNVANGELNKEIRDAQKRAKQLTDATQRLGRIEIDLRNKTNKMDMGYAPNDPKVRERLKKVQEAQAKVSKMRDQNLKYRQKVEGPLREQLKDVNTRLETLASEIRNQDGPAREAQIKNVQSLIRSALTVRKRLNDGPGFHPDLGGKEGSGRLDLNKVYDSIKID